MKLSKLLLLIFIGLLLVGCAPSDDDIPADEDNKEEEQKLNDINSWVKGLIQNIITEDIDLPTTHPTLGGEITWESFSPEIIGNDGKIVAGTKDGEVMLGYTISLDGLDKVITDVLVSRVITYTIDEVALDFADQFSIIITRNYNINVNQVEGFVITWSSSDPTVFSNNGEYIKPLVDTPITLNYTVSFNGETKSFTKEVTVQGTTFSEKVSEITNWITDEYLPTREISSEISLPSKYEKYNANITWRSGNVGVISTNGTVKQFGFDRYVTLEGAIDINGDISVVDYSLVVAAKEIGTKEEKINSFLEAIATPALDNLEFTSYYNMNQSYNFLPFYRNVNAPVVEQIRPLGGSRPGTKLTSLEFITIHDTANNNIGAGGQTHANLMSNRYDAASWHYAIDEIGAWHSVPNDEVAWHAGDGGRLFNLTDTDIKATTRYPRITISVDGFYEFNGEKSGIKAPLVSGKAARTSDIAPAGLYTEIGLNGNYYLNATYFNNSFGKISNAGGNYNSIGIETCVNQGTDYATTLRHTAKLVAELLIEGGLTPDRVLQHNNFSGKDCPNAMRHVNYWNNFLDLVSLEKYAKENFSDVEFNWTSLTTVLDNNGKIAKVIGSTTSVEYIVTATYGTETITRQFSTILNG